MKGVILMGKQKHKKCPKCGKEVIYVIGNGWDYDHEWCSDMACDYDYEHDTTTYLTEE